jgi:hypothetical protein
MKKFFSTKARPVYYWWLMCFALLAGGVIRKQNNTIERVSAYALLSLESIRYELILRSRDLQLAKDRYYLLVSLTSIEFDGVEVVTNKASANAGD